MHAVSITVKNPLGLEVGSELLCEDVNAGEMLSRGWCTVESVKSKVESRKFDPSKDWNGKRMLFVRPGGFGDLLFLTPTIAELKSRFPGLSIDVACFDRFRNALLHNPDIDKLVRYPVALSDWDTYDARVWLEGAIEQNPDALTRHAVDVIAGRVGIDLNDFGLLERQNNDAKKMRYFVTEEERSAAEAEFPRSDIPRIGFQMSASGACRIYPHMREVSKLVWQNGREIFLFGRPGEFKSNEPEGVINLMAKNKTFRESCAILATCDCVVAPDSALVHVAGALGIPCVALYGPFPWNLRTKYSPKTFAIQGIGYCSPCFHHARPGSGPFPEHGPCYQTGRCEVLAAIPAERVFREIEKKLEKAPVKKRELRLLEAPV